MPSEKSREGNIGESTNTTDETAEAKKEINTHLSTVQYLIYLYFLQMWNVIRDLEDILDPFQKRNFFLSSSKVVLFDRAGAHFSVYAKEEEEGEEEAL